MKKKLVAISLILIVFLGCDSGLKKKIITSEDGLNSLTIISKDAEYYIFKGKLDLDKIPANGYVKNKGVVEHFNALVKWSNGQVDLYHTYGVFDESKKPKDIILNRVSVKEFERLKKLPEYEYFYY
ncbi:hypothetical protein D9V96_020480 [Zobellia laminariae]|uniref:hypothetical protein n=1 Tax=Zobellia laminariae TaxID=248906 RepID=UPI00405656B5